MKTYIQLIIGFGLVVAGSAIGSAYASGSRELLLSAPIEQLDRSADTITVLGKKFHTAATDLVVGQTVRIYGILSKDGSIEDAVVQATESYAANGDPVFVKGVVTQTDALLGRAEVGGMTIDYTSELSDPGFVAPTAGDIMDVAAAQPVNKGVLVAFASGLDAYSLGTRVSDINATFAGVQYGQAADGLDGTKAAGMNGGGRASAGMNGGGRAAAGMNGGGLRTAGMNGGGR